MSLNINKIICFKLMGKFAHFRKFYTNSSSLSYLIPPRTVVSGVIASILKIPRDDYYEEFNIDKVGLSVSIPTGLSLKKQMQSMNYLHNSYFNLIAKGKGKVQHSQCKLELVMGIDGSLVEYIVYVGFHNEHDIFGLLEEKLIKQDLGYGTYLGQRQFRCHLEYMKTYTDKEFEFCKKSDFLDSVCIQENILELKLTDGIDIQKEQMTAHFIKQSGGRDPVCTQQVIFEKKGKRLTGLFKNCIKIDDIYISFY